MPGSASPRAARIAEAATRQPRYGARFITMSDRCSCHCGIRLQPDSATAATRARSDRPTSRAAASRQPCDALPHRPREDVDLRSDLSLCSKDFSDRALETSAAADERTGGRTSSSADLFHAHAGGYLTLARP